MPLEMIWAEVDILGFERRLRRNLLGKDRVDGNLGSIKMKIPPFQGRNYP